jgi:hypothetical protein
MTDNFDGGIGTLISYCRRRSGFSITTEDAQIAAIMP